MSQGRSGWGRRLAAGLVFAPPVALFLWGVMRAVGFFTDGIYGWRELRTGEPEAYLWLIVALGPAVAGIGLGLLLRKVWIWWAGWRPPGGPYEA